MIEARFPAAYAKRRAEADEDGESAPASGVMDLPVAFIPCTTPSTSRAEPEASGAELVFPPGIPVDLQLFEPRYLALIDRVMASAGRRFGVQPSETATMGSVLRAERVQRLPDGRVLVKAEVEARYRVLTRRERDEGLGVAPASASEALAIDEVAGMSGLCVAYCSPLRDEDADTVASAGAGLHGRLLRCASGLVARSGRRALTINGRFGQPPLLPGPLSFYLTALLDLSPAERRACMEGTSIGERQARLLAFLESVVPAQAADHAGGGAAAAGGASPGEGLAAGATVGAAPGEEGDALDRVEASRALWILSATGGGGGAALLGVRQVSGPAAFVMLAGLLLLLLLLGDPERWVNAHQGIY